MTRSGVERKPTWRQVPAAIKAEVERILGSHVARAERVFGGYGPSATFRMRLADGRRAFFKAVNATSNDHMRRAMEREERVYRELGTLLHPWAPAFLGALHHEDWHALLLEDCGPADVPPWTERKVALATRSYADFHRSTLGRELPDWLGREHHAHFASMWRDLAETEGGLRHLAALADGRILGEQGDGAPSDGAADGEVGERAAEARAWLDAHLGTLAAVAVPLAAAPPPYALIHFDTRSDNVRVGRGQLRIFDWPFASEGPVEFDVAAFAQSVEAEDGPSAERVIAAYEEHLPLRDDVLVASVAAIAGYFALRSWQLSMAGLPRLRSIQRRQLRASLAWAARLLRLPAPTWLEAVPR